MQEQQCRPPYSAGVFILAKVLSSRFATTLTCVCSCLLLSTGAIAAVHDSDDPFEVEGPAIAVPSRHALPARDDLAARGPVSRRVQALVSSAAQLGLSGAQIPPHRATSLRLPAQDPTDNPTALSLSVVDDYPALVGLSSEDLLPLSVKEGGKITYVHFRQQVAGVPVLHSHVVFQWDRAGRLRSTGSDVFVSELGSSPTPQFTSSWIALEDARIEALRGMPADLEVTEWEREEQAWLPLAGAVSGAATSGPFELIPVWSIRFRTENPAGRYDVVVDAETGSLMSRESRMRFESLTGTVTADVEFRTVGDPQQQLPLRDVFGQVLGFGGPFPTDGAGQFQSDVPAGEQNYVASLFGQHIYIQNALDNLSIPTDTLAVTVPGTIDVHWNDTNSAPSQRDAYYHGNVAYQEIRRIDDTAGLAALDAPMRTDVDDASGDCNAFWDGTRMNFYAQSSRCVSIARIADVVYHEYGHAITEFTWAPLNAPSDMHEGFSDYFAATLTENPVIGNGFFGPGSALREIDTDLIWPDDISGDPHRTGLIIAGALWDVRAELGRELTDERWHFAGYGGAQNFHDYMLDMLIYDDDDADLTNGSPNFEVIVRNFRKHGIGDYSVSIHARELPDIESPGTTIDGTVSIGSLLPLDANSLALFYSLNDEEEFTRQSLTAVSGAPEDYSFSIPTPELGTTVHYYWSASNEEGENSTYPEEAPAATFSFFVGEDLRLRSFQQSARPRFWPIRRPSSTSGLQFRTTLSEWRERGSSTASAMPGSCMNRT